MKIAIIGFSRFGQLWTRLMKNFGEVTVFNRSDQSETARQLGVSFFSFDQLEEIGKADLVFIAVAMSITEEIIKKIKPFIKSDTVVMDVCSVKVFPCQWLEENFSDSIQIMGTHPMFGPDSAKSGLKGKQIVLCPLRIDQEKLDQIKNIFKKLELEIIETTPEDHDKQTAYSLALVHFLGRGLEKLDFNKINIKTYGFDIISQIRENVSNDSWQLFEDMQKLNPYGKEARKELLESLQAVDLSLKKIKLNKRRKI